VGDKVSYKIRKLFNEQVPALLIEKQSLLDRYDSHEDAEKQLNKKIDIIAEKIRYTNMREINKVESSLNQELVKVVKENYSTTKPASEEHKYLEQEIEMKIHIIKRVIDIKKSYQKKLAYPVERNIIEHGLFDSSSPTNDTLKRMRTSQGIIERYKNGFRRLYYRNDNGNFLTSFDCRVLIGIMKIWQDKGEEKEFDFDFKDLLKVIELDLNGGNYGTIAKSVDNIARTQIIMEEYLEPKTKKRTKTTIHHPIQNAEIDTVDYKVHIHLNDLLHNSLKAGNYVNISMALFNDLANDTSKNLYMFIINYIPSQQSKGEQLLEIDPLIEYLGINASTKTKKINLIKDALEELKSYDILKSWEVSKVGRTYKYVRFEESTWLRETTLIPDETKLYIE
jgi:hypothetical protein